MGLTCSTSINSIHQPADCIQMIRTQSTKRIATFNIKDSLTRYFVVGVLTTSMLLVLPMFWTCALPMTFDWYNVLMIN